LRDGHCPPERRSLGTATSRLCPATNQKGRFEGKVTIKELRERTAPAPDLPPNHRCLMTAGRFSAWAGARRSRRHGRITADSFVRISTPRDQPMNNGFALIAYENRRPGEEPSVAPALLKHGGFNRGGDRPRLSRR